MAYDPEARETGNSAMIIGIIVLVLLVGGALAYFATRPGDAPGPDVIVDQNPPSSTTTIIEDNQPAPAPAPDSGDTVIVQPPSTSTETNTTITTEKTTEEAPAADAPAADAPPADAPAAP